MDDSPATGKKRSRYTNTLAKNVDQLMENEFGMDIEDLEDEDTDSSGDESLEDDSSRH